MKTKTLSLLALAAFGCATPEDQLELAEARALPVDAAGPPLTLEVTDAPLGGTMFFRVNGANPNERVYVVRSTNGLGTGACVPQLGGQCFGVEDPVDLHTEIVTDASGAAVVSMRVPNLRALEGAEVCFQGAAIRGTGGSQSVLTAPTCILAGADDDGDGVINPRDPCPTGDEYFDWDQDGIADGCDTGAGVPATYTTEVPLLPWTDTTFQNRQVISSIPANPVGVVFLFHGTNGSAELVEAPETMRTMNTWNAAGIGFVALSSDNRSNGLFDDSRAPSNNNDYQRVADYRAQLIAQGVIRNTTPLVMAGYSAGGSFASYMGHAASSWPIRAVILHHSTGFSDLYGPSADVPTLFLASENDTSVDASLVQQRFNEHRGRGFDGQYFLRRMQRLEPTRFAQSSFINNNKALDLWRLAVDNGYFDGSGNWLRGTNDIPGTIEDIVNLPNFSPDPPARGVLNAIAATHVWNGASADAETTFLLNRL